MSFLVPSRGTKIPLSIIVLVICGFMFFVLLYTERISLMSSSTLSSNVLKLKSCPRKDLSSKPSKNIRIRDTRTSNSGFVFLLLRCKQSHNFFFCFYVMDRGESSRKESSRGEWSRREIRKYGCGGR